MKTYWVYYSCPHCPHPCNDDGPDKEYNEGMYADSKTEAREYFQNNKPCRWMKITRIKEED